MIRLTRHEAPEIGKSIRDHLQDNPVFAMFMSDIADDVDLKKATDAEIGHLFAKWCNEC